MPEEATVRSVITPNDQFLRSVFNTAKAYFIDIYQREYKWTPDNVKTLLNDIEVQFGINQRTNTEPKQIQAEVQERFEPYFLNTYLTHSTPTNTSIVDGQQRLTTLLLVLIKLHKILKTIESDHLYTVKTFSSQTLEKLIFESDDFGEAKRFKIFNENRESTFRQLLEGPDIKPVDETQKRIKENYEIISQYYDNYFMSEGEPGRYDVVKLTYYIAYLLDRISIVEIKIEKQKNVAMIFEVVNDRGLGLKPYEILKGKLIGNLPANQKEHANTVWTELQNSYFNAELKNSTESKLDLDLFFRTFFRAKFADTEDEYEKFEGAYHYEVYRNGQIRKYFKDFNDPQLLYSRIVRDIQYFAKMYLWLRTSYDNEYLLYNKLLDQNQQYLLILSGLEENDADKESKISGIAKKFDQLHSVTRLLGAYESNSFQRVIYPLNKEIRNKSLTQIATIFNSTLISILEEREIVRKGDIKCVEDIFTYERFKGVSNNWTNYSKYVLMRIDRYLWQLLDKPTYVGTGLEQLEDRFNKTTRRRYGLHLEHIYAYNEPNMAQFTDGDQGFDEHTFNIERNRLGMVLLLKDLQNLSSNNEIYRDKIETYKKSNFIWNELLVGHLPEVDKNRLPDDLRVEVIQPNASGAFPRTQIESRQRLTFNAIKKLWCFEN
ncbi:MAG: DUF262 domain-containing protein [Dehalococcoidales bacterium]|nr:DUF262 domain-containing protein [Dehalococcoidales bacterium]